jgi:tRNA-specific 2-thiouridylase
MTENRQVVVAMSGGVDSSVAAAILLQQGYQVIGMMLRLWSEPGMESHNRCCTPDSMSQARRVAAILGIPFYVIDAREIFHSKVVTYFIDGYTHGTTPNPCLVCNRSIRWEFLLGHALALGAQYMATGHYARVISEGSGLIQLLRAVDRDKDQSYILHILEQDQLKHALFPLGDYTKSEVRRLAHQFGLPTAERPDSQDLCFLGDGDLRQFILRNAPQSNSPGPILDIDGIEIGQHSGLAFYTIGQRKGLGVNTSIPLYVVEKNLTENTLVVGPRESLGKSILTACHVNWVSGQPPPMPIRLQVKIRYKAPEAWGIISSAGEGCVSVRFDSPLRDITPGQAVVFYDNDQVLGGGIIKK